MGSPIHELLISCHLPRPRFHFIANRHVGQHHQGMPDPRREINPHTGIVWPVHWVSRQPQPLQHLALFIKDQESDFSLQHEERFGFRRLRVPVRGEIGSPAHHVQEAVQVGIHRGMEIVVHPSTGRFLRTHYQIAHQRGVNRLNLFFHGLKIEEGFYRFRQKPSIKNGVP